jgi:hypothetical protein
LMRKFPKRCMEFMEKFFNPSMVLERCISLQLHLKPKEIY